VRRKVNPLLRISNVFSYKFVKYGLVGILGTGLHFSVLICLVKLLGCNVVFSSTIGFIIVLIISYFLNKYWTFNSSGHGLQEFIKYAVVSLIGLFLNTIIIYVCTYILELNYIIGQFCVVFIVPISNYFFNSMWSFKEKSDFVRQHKGQI
jgi:putative flippase GtrA